MQGDVEHVRIAEKNTLGSITMVAVKINNSHLVQMLQGSLNSDCNVIEVTEARDGIATGVMSRRTHE